jgi:tRNA dimethylallyltransferase
MFDKPTILCLMGPTASGKTALAVELVREFTCDIISVDSAMVYRGMDIGTAKPEADILAKAPHRLIDIRDPIDTYSAADFRADALKEIESIVGCGRIPLLVGGTMLYFHALQQGLSLLPSANAEIRTQLLTQLQEQGLDALHKQLRRVDPESALRIHPHDPQRLMRALEVYMLTGESLTELHHRTKNHAALPYNMVNLALIPSDRDLLSKRIADRFTQMLAQGFVAEVEHFFHRGDLTENTPSMRAVGYRQVWNYLAGVGSEAQMQEHAVIATRQLAKRQLTWLRSWQDVICFDAEDSLLSDKLFREVSLQTHM